MAAQQAPAAGPQGTPLPSDNPGAPAPANAAPGTWGGGQTFGENLLGAELQKGGA